MKVSVKGLGGLLSSQT